MIHGRTINRDDDVARLHSSLVCGTARLNDPNYSTARAWCVFQGQADETLDTRLSHCGYE
jgi:hypothetical protein